MATDSDAQTGPGMWRQWKDIAAVFTDDHAFARRGPKSGLLDDAVSDPWLRQDRKLPDPDQGLGDDDQAAGLERLGELGEIEQQET